MPAPPCPPGPDPSLLLAWSARVRASGHAATAEGQRLARLLSGDGLHGPAGTALADLGHRVAGDLHAVARHCSDAADALVAVAHRASQVPQP